MKKIFMITAVSVLSVTTAFADTAPSDVTTAKMMFEGTIMPGFYIDSGYERPLKKFDGKSILSAQQLEDVVAYLLTLKD